MAKGFTIIELIGVLLILGVLSGLVAHRMVKVDASAQKTVEEYQDGATDRHQGIKDYMGVE